MHTIRAHALAGLGRVALTAGDSAQWTRLVAEARTIVAEHGLEHIPTLAPVFAASALSLAMQGRLEDAEGEALHALRQTSLMRGLAPWFGVLGRLQLARAFLLLHDRTRARVLLDEAVALRGPATQSPMLSHLLRETADLVRHVEDIPGQGPSSLTTAELRVLQYLPSRLTLEYIAEELYVSRHTVKTQVAAVYRKLGATSRADAVRAARGMGLLPAV
jgi:LuxR family maltose regulon positive regulatory protein